MVTKEEIMKELEKVLDPHVGIPITEMKLVDDVKVDDKGNVHVDFHGSIPFCPMAVQIGNDIRNRVKAMSGMESVRVEINNHVNAEEINKKINEE
jgi:ATP-binding protein involved in chromosome partitioning